MNVFTSFCHACSHVPEIKIFVLLSSVLLHVSAGIFSMIGFSIWNFWDYIIFNQVVFFIVIAVLIILLINSNSSNRIRTLYTLLIVMAIFLRYYAIRNAIDDYYFTLFFLVTPLMFFIIRFVLIKYSSGIIGNNYFAHKFFLIDTTETVDDYVYLSGENKEDILEVMLLDLCYIKSEENYCEIYFCGIKNCDGKFDKKCNKKIFRTSMKNLIHQLENYESIIQVHKSYTINLLLVSKIEGNINNSKAFFKGYDVEVPIARSKRNVVLDQFNTVRKLSRATEVENFK